VIKKIQCQTFVYLEINYHHFVDIKGQCFCSHLYCSQSSYLPTHGQLVSW